MEAYMELFDQFLLRQFKKSDETTMEGGLRYANPQNDWRNHIGSDGQTMMNIRLTGENIDQLISQDEAEFFKKSFSESFGYADDSIERLVREYLGYTAENMPAFTERILKKAETLQNSKYKKALGGAKETIELAIGLDFLSSWESFQKAVNTRYTIDEGALNSLMKKQQNQTFGERLFNPAADAIGQKIADTINDGSIWGHIGSVGKFLSERMKINPPAGTGREPDPATQKTPDFSNVEPEGFRPEPAPVAKEAPAPPQVQQQPSATPTEASTGVPTEASKKGAPSVKPLIKDIPAAAVQPESQIFKKALLYQEEDALIGLLKIMDSQRNFGINTFSTATSYDTEDDNLKRY